MTRLLRRPAAILLLGLTIQVLPAAGADWDLLIRGARVIDPESGLKAIRDVAMNGGRIVAIAEAEVRRGIREGGLGIGMAHAYYPGADRSEILEVFETAAALQIPIYTHARGLGLDAVQEVLANAAATGAALHIVHINSTTLGEIEPALRLVRSARLRGVDVTTEAYPYTAASTLIQSSLFDGEWQSAYGISYDGLQWQATGERLTEQSCNEYRRQGGMDADLVLFDPQRVIDTATFESGPSFSEGIEYVFVGGIAVVDDGALVPGAFPGQAIRGQLPGAAQPGP